MAGVVGCEMTETGPSAADEKRRPERQVVGHCGQRVLGQLGPLCGFEPSLIRGTRRTAAFQYGERVLSTLSGQLMSVCPMSAQAAKAVVRLVRIGGLQAMSNPQPYLRSCTRVA